MCTKTTLVLDPMPSLFWQLVDEAEYREYFTSDNLLFSEDIEIIILRTKSTITESHYKRFPNLKCVIRAGSGYDNIDVSKAKDYGIQVQNTPQANVNSAYEHTISMISALIKNHKAHNSNVLNNKWREGIESNLEFSDLKALIVGFGRVGSRVGNLLKVLGAQVKFVDPYIDAESVQKQYSIEAISYQDGLSWANLVTFHCPLYSQTQHYFNKASLSLISKVYLINVARGGIVETDALTKGLDDGKIIAAGIDVMESEPWQCEGWENSDKVIITPHAGAMTEKAKDRLSQETFNVWSKFNFEKKAISLIKVW